MFLKLLKCWAHWWVQERRKGGGEGGTRGNVEGGKKEGWRVEGGGKEASVRLWEIIVRIHTIYAGYK